LLDARDAARRKVQKKRSVQDLLDRLDAWKPLRDQVVQHQGVVDAVMISSLRSQWDAFAAKADARSTGLFDAQQGEILNPHELRIAGKMLRYTFEMRDEAGNTLPPLVSRTFKRMQKALGDWHDCVVLGGCAMQMSLDEALALRDPPMQARTLELIRFVLRRGDRALRRFAQLWQENGPALAQVVEGMAVNEPRTGRDPARSVEMSRPALRPPGASSAA
jgi:CHAD domain-containing protein